MIIGNKNDTISLHDVFYSLHYLMIIRDNVTNVMLIEVTIVEIKNLFLYYFLLKYEYLIYL